MITFIKKLGLFLTLGSVFLLWQNIPVSAQGGGTQLVDSVEVYQKKMESLISERLNSVVPNQNYVLRIFIYGKNVDIPISRREIKSFELPGFRRSGMPQERSEEKFRIERVTIRILINENLAPAEVDYIRSIVPVLAEFNEERGDELNLEVVPPAPPKLKKVVEADPVLDEPETPSDFGTKDWILLAVMGLILFLLLIVLIRVLFTPKKKQLAESIQPLAAPPQSPLAEQQLKMAEQARKEEEEALQLREMEDQLNTLRHKVVKSLFARGDLGKNMIDAWMEKPDKVNGLIHALGTTIARSALLPHMNRESYTEMEKTVMQDKPVPPEKQIELLKEANLFLITQNLADPEEIRPDPFVFLRNMSWGQIGHLIKDEPVNIKAIVLSRINAKFTALILEGMPKEMQLEVAVQIGNLQSMPLEMAEEVALDLAVKARHVPDAKTVDIIGPQALVEVMGRSSQDMSQYLLKAMKAKDTKLSEAVEKKFFMFEAIPMVPPDILPQVVRAMPSNTVVQAMFGADQEIQRQVIMAFPEQARTGLVTTLRASQFDEETVMEARRQVVLRFQALAEQGKIDLKQISDAFQAKAS